MEDGNEIFKTKEGESFLQNFALFVPSGVLLNYDGTPAMFVDPNDKTKFIEYLVQEGIDLESKDIHEREELFKEWKSK